MKMIVDSSVAFKWFVREQDTDKALRIRDDYRIGVVDLFAPDVFPVEFAHAITRAERQKRITPLEGAQAIADLLTMLPRLSLSLLLLPRAYEISSTMRCGVYDCLYVAMAERESCDFVTADDKAVKNLKPHFPFIVALSSLP